MPEIFEDNSLFSTTSKTAASKNRLNWRTKALLENNITAIKNKRILDLASHDGRFSYAAVKLGATFVKGIEGRPYLVQYAIQNFQKYKIPSTLYSFEVGDIFKKLEEVTPGSFDTVLCLGIFYHVLHHARLLELIERTQAQFLILDTRVALAKGSYKKLPEFFLKIIGWLLFGALQKPWKPAIIQLYPESSAIEGATIDTHNLSGMPSQEGVEVLLKHFSFKFQQINWFNLGIKNWKHLEDYRKRRRVSYFCERI